MTDQVLTEVLDYIKEEINYFSYNEILVNLFCIGNLDYSKHVKLTQDIIAVIEILKAREETL